MEYIKKHPIIKSKPYKGEETKRVDNGTNQPNNQNSQQEETKRIVEIKQKQDNVKINIINEKIEKENSNSNVFSISDDFLDELYL
jgi:hypothetical protein